MRKYSSIDKYIVSQVWTRNFLFFLHLICKLVTKLYQQHNTKGKKNEERNGSLTKAIPSLVASARISAQETVALQEASTLVLMASITSKPLAEFLLGPAFFSPVKVEVSSNNIDPSHPYKIRK